MKKKIKKKRLKKKIKIFLSILLIISIITITSLLYKNIRKENTPLSNTNSVYKEDKIANALKNLDYTEENISFIKQYLSEDNINYLINNKINAKKAMDIINETYYIDEYLQKYLSYQEENPTYNSKDIITIINTHINDKFYTNTIPTDTSLGKFVLLNKYYYADNTYPSKDLITVDGKYHINETEVKLTKECYDAFLKMYEDAYEAGYGFKLKSAYRSFDTQVSTYNYWVSTENGNKDKADTYSARPGHSEHQTGYAFDIRDYNYEYEDYSKSASFIWVSKNAHKYGFIIRFPENKEHITGYQYESWHYRYCGVECATYIYENDITFEEYYEYFIRFNNPRKLKS